MASKFIAAIILMISMALLESFECNENIPRSSDLDNMKCDSIVCASIVSKCLLTSDCKCDNIHTNKSCADNCSRCLDYLYQDCCLCFDLCELKTNDDKDNEQRSNVGHIQDPQPDFFTLLNELPDPLERWKTITYSLILPIEISRNLPNQDQEQNSSEFEMKCIVSYMSQCLSMNKCRSACASMGSTTFRWFHDGCCECVGQYCNEFGLDKSNCTACPLIITNDSFDREDL